MIEKKEKESKSRRNTIFLLYVEVKYLLVGDGCVLLTVKKH
jgi:hypothetical protein